MGESINNDPDAKEIEALTGAVVDRDAEKSDGFNPAHRQILAASGIILMTICAGMVSGFSAILLPQLHEDDSLIKVNKQQESWIASMAPLPMFVGCFFSGWAMERFGRKTTNLLGAVLIMAGWLCIYLGTTVEFLLVGRLITGFSIGASGASGSCYIGEITHPKLRGIFLACISLGIALGLFVTHLMGTFLTWKTTALICLIVPVLTLLLILLTPESHVWYIKNNDFKKAKEVFRWFRGYSQEATDELMKIMNGKSGKKDIKLHDLMRAQFLKPLMILVLFFVTVQFAGNNAVVFYSVSIMQSTVPTLDRYAAMLIVDAIRIVMSVIACIMTKRYRVRMLTMVSGLGTAFSLYFLSIFVYLSKVNSAFSVIPMIALVAYIVFISIGLVPLPWTICGELLHPDYKGIGGGISTSINFLAFFLVVKTSPDMFESLGTPGTFITYASLALLGTGILYFILPETKNKTLKEIEEYFAGKPKSEPV